MEPQSAPTCNPVIRYQDIAAFGHAICVPFRQMETTRRFPR